ncbi:ferric reduction oxidase 2-like isoform X2 [Diospyros lotus]|uniref:ferric reduction oxidase 2-like isoform X2 n=1 Tax=Diospyros lotus TaxID=55363 RepID=UPI00225AB254|nr:ferric reduction oxidase 2-like isoform X2 [Diospyros lotus]
MDARVTMVKRSTPSSHELGASNALRAATMAVVVVILLGHIMILVMTPTKVFRQKWLPKLRVDANSTFFGPQGVTILLYPFPILLLAVLACVYVHLGKRYGSINMGRELKQRLGIWKRPEMIKGLGIVSRIEVAFLAMFLALLVWSFSTYLRIAFASINPQSAAKVGEKVWEAKLGSAALRLGLVGNICLCFLFYPVTRGSSVLPFFGLTSEASVKYHIWIGHILMTLFTAHGVCQIIYWIVTDQSSQMLKWSKTEVSNVGGELSLIAGLLMWVTSFHGIRRRMFELFFYTHHLYILFIVFYIFHVGISYACIMLPGFYLFLLDRFLRFLQSRQGVRLVSARVLPCEIVELNFSKSPGLSYSPTSSMFMNVPSISKLQWHPFTISSSSNLEPEKLSVIIKGEGSWTKKLNHMVSSSSLDHLDVSIEGPYGPVSTDFLLRHETLVMVSGGSGITPFISMIREFIFMSETLKHKTPKLQLIAAFKNSSDLTILDLILPISTNYQLSNNFDIQIDAYVTREKEPTLDHSNYNSKPSIRSVWFKPKPSDLPISPTLGPSSWLWLAAIISSSFIIFLILMGTITRYHIYPIDHNTNHIYSMASRSALNMALICFSIATTASAAFYWNKKQNMREANQIKSLEGPTPAGSPSSWFFNADREMESLPQLSLSQSTTVHYGERPDLKRIMFEHKEASIGVLVCGPKKLRHEVARICSSGLADNLHFKSISFSW